MISYMISHSARFQMKTKNLKRSHLVLICFFRAQSACCVQSVSEQNATCILLLHFAPRQIARKTRCKFKFGNHFQAPYYHGRAESHGRTGPGGTRPALAGMNRMISLSRRVIQRLSPSNVATVTIITGMPVMLLRPGPMAPPRRGGAA